MRRFRCLILFSLVLLATPCFWSQAACPVKGDLNNDGVVDTADAVLLVNYLAGNVQLLSAGEQYADDGIVGVLRYVPAGTFTQGSPSDEPCRYSDETQFTHTLTRNIVVMETEVTRQMWANLQAAQPTLPADPTATYYGSGMDHPVQNNSWYEAVLFANLLSVERGLTRCYYKDAAYTQPVDASNYTSGDFYWKPDANGYRLLSEGEWEYACRAGTTTPFWIDEPNYNSGICHSCSASLPALSSVAWWCGNDEDRSSPAGSKAANPWGLYDTHGNVWEWCWDWFGTYPSGSATEYKGVSSGSNRVARGGTWGNYAQDCRSASRTYGPPGARDSGLGFRLARSLP